MGENSYRNLDFVSATKPIIRRQLKCESEDEYDKIDERVQNEAITSRVCRNTNDFKGLHPREYVSKNTNY